MVSFWPFKGDDNSAASFEKTLSQLSTRINKSTARNEGLRQSQRRFKVLWTLYSSFAYILVALILTLVTGWDSWGAVEYTVVAGGPVLIYGVRTILDAYYNYRLSNTQNSLNELYKQRDTAIERLKAATKYNSTQQLLDKYGGQKRQPSPKPPSKRKSDGPQSYQSTPQGPRTGFVPPATANIPGRSPPGLPSPPSPEGMSISPPTPVGAPGRVMPPSMSPQSGNLEPSEDFAPNAFDAPMPPTRAPTQYAADGPKWYDRILDAVLGEDETQARNRIALICQNCRLVNGQAAPGLRTAEELGRWRCSSCQAWNGVESEEKKILSQISKSGSQPAYSHEEVGGVQDVEDMEEEGESDEESDAALPVVGGAEEGTPAGSTRSKARQRKKA